MTSKFYAICDEDDGIIEINGQLAVYSSKEKATTARDNLKSPKYYHIERCHIESLEW